MLSVGDSDDEDPTDLICEKITADGMQIVRHWNPEISNDDEILGTPEPSPFYFCWSVANVENKLCSENKNNEVLYEKFGINITQDKNMGEYLEESIIAEQNIDERNKVQKNITLIKV